MASLSNANGHHYVSHSSGNAFPYSLQPQPPSIPKTTGGKRGPSAPIAIPSLSKAEDGDEDSDQSITDHTPPSQNGRLAHFDSLGSSPSPTVLTNRGSERGGSFAAGQVHSPRGQAFATTKKLGQNISSPKTLLNSGTASTNNTNNSNTHISNLNNSLPLPASSSTLSSTSSTTPILIIHANNTNSSSRVNVIDNVNNNSSSISSVTVSPNNNGSSLLAPTNISSTNGGGLITSHPLAPWVSPQNNSNATNSIGNFISTSSKHGSSLTQTSSSSSKVPKLVENPLQPKGQKLAENHMSAFPAVDSSSSNHSSTNSSSGPITVPCTASTAATKSSNGSNNSLTVGVQDATSAPKPDHTGSTALLLSPNDTISDADVPSSSSPTSSSSNSCFAYELDHDYENVASPCSSTASGPTYVRQPGFRHHAHEVTLPAGSSTTAASSSASSAHASSTLFSTSLSPSASSGIGGGNNIRFKQKKKCSATLVNFREGFKKREATPPKLKPKREPLPMKLRALPQSFWQQPNVAHQVSPATLFPILPPLPNKDNEETLMDVRPVTPPEERDGSRKVQPPERKLTVANTDLLFKLFDVVADDKKAPVHKTRQQNKPPRKPVPKSNTKGLFLGNDPYMVEDVTEKILPQLTLDAGSRSHGYQAGVGNSSLQLISLKEGDRTVQLPSLSMEQNYPQMLSELVMHI